MNIFGFIIHQKVNLMKLDHQRLFDLFTEEYIKEFGTDKDVKDVSCNGLLERATAKETNKGKQRVFSLVNYGYLGDYVVWVEHFTDGEFDHKTWYAKLAYYINIQYSCFEFSFSNVACYDKKINQNFRWENFFGNSRIISHEEETEYEWIKHVEIITATQFFVGYVAFTDEFYDKKEVALTKFLCGLNEKVKSIK